MVEQPGDLRPQLHQEADPRSGHLPVERKHLEQQEMYQVMLPVLVEGFAKEVLLLRPITNGRSDYRWLSFLRFLLHNTGKSCFTHFCSL